VVSGIRLKRDQQRQIRRELSTEIPPRIDTAGDRKTLVRLGLKVAEEIALLRAHERTSPILPQESRARKAS
jgi:hypothetical protein